MEKRDSINLNDDELNIYKHYLSIFSNNGNRPGRIILGFYRGNFTNMIKACICLVFQRSPAWVLPLVTAEIVNIATQQQKNGGTLILVQLLIAMVFLLQNIGSSYLATIYFAKVNRHIEGTLRNVLIRKLQYLSIMFHKETQSGRLQSKVMRDVENVYELLNQIFKTIFFFVLDVMIAIIVCANRSPLVLLFFLFSVPISVFVLYWFRKPVRSCNNEFRNEMEVTQGAVAQMLEMIPITRAHGLQESEIGKMNYFLNKIVNRGYRLDLVNSLFGASNWVTFQIFQILCLTFTGFLALNRKISIGEVVLYQTYFTQIVSQVSTLINIYPQVCKGIESVKSIGSILDEPNVENNNAIIPLGKLKGEVQFCNVDYKYPDSDRWILKDFSLNVTPGECIAFVGESGGGKSTILHLLIGLIATVNGKILIDGINIANLNMNEYRSQIAVVPQNTILFDGTIRDNIVYGLSDVSDEEVKSIISEVGLEEVIEKMPRGLDTTLGEHGDKLSGGQKQRISIARALIRHPKIIIFDEATSALDNSSEKIVQEATERMMKNCTTFVVAHRLSTIKNADRIMVMKHGRITEEGSYLDLLEKKGEFYKMLNSL